MRRNYTVENHKLVRNNPFCPRCGEGVFMADKGGWWSCGKCGDKYYKKTFHQNQTPNDLDRALKIVTCGDRQ